MMGESGVRRTLERIPGARSLLEYKRRVLNDPPATGSFATSADEARGQDLPNGCELGRMFLAHQGRLIHKWPHYLPAYERHFTPFRRGFPLPDGSFRPLRFLEIGVSHGGSLQLWRSYFGSDAVIFGIDVDDRCGQFNDDRLNVRIGSQADGEFLRNVVAEMGGVDIVVDDGSHRATHQAASFAELFPLLSEGGLYVVEDLHTAYWRDFGGGYRRRDSFMEFAKDLVDGLHAWYYRRPPPPRAALAKTEITSVCFYDSMVFIEKHAKSRPVNVRVGTPSFG